MPDDVKAKLQGREATLKKEFEDTQKMRESVIEQGKELQRKLNEIEAKLQQLRGSYAEIQSLLEPEPPKKEVKKVK